jgi:hypothetical protein
VPRQTLGELINTFTFEDLRTQKAGFFALIAIFYQNYLKVKICLRAKKKKSNRHWVNICEYLRQNGS